MGHAHSSPLYGNKAGACRTPQKQHRGKRHVTLEAPLKTSGLLFPESASSAVQFARQFPEEEEGLLCPSQSELLPLLSVWCVSLLRADSHFPECAKNGA